jgi:hypothetical protein
MVAYEFIRNPADLQQEPQIPPMAGLCVNKAIFGWTKLTGIRSKKHALELKFTKNFTLFQIDARQITLSV